MTRLDVRAKPGSRKGTLVEVGADGVVTVHVKERAIDGAANTAVIAALAEHFGVRKRDVTILRGHSSRIKVVEIESRDAEG